MTWTARAPWGPHCRDLPCHEVRPDHVQTVASRLVRAQHQSRRLNCWRDETLKGCLEAGLLRGENERCSGSRVVPQRLSVITVCLTVPLEGVTGPRHRRAAWPRECKMVVTIRDSAWPRSCKSVGDGYPDPQLIALLEWGRATFLHLDFLYG